MKSSFEAAGLARENSFVAFSQGPSGRANPAARPAPEAGPSLEQRLEEAYQRGREDEVAARPAIDPARLEGAAAALGDAADSLAAASRDEVGACSASVVELALLVAERIVRSQVPGEWEGLRARIEAALAGLAGDEPPSIELCPDDLEICRSHQAGAMDGLFARTDLHFEANPALGSGEAVVRAGAAEIDARVEAMLEPFRAELRALLTPRGDAS